MRRGTGPQSPPELLLAGLVGKPHGVSGEVHVVPISDDPRRFDAGSVLVHQDERTLVVEDSRRHGERLLVKFAGIGTRTDADRLRGAVYVTGDRLRELQDGEYWEHEIVGSTVVDADGGELGRVSGLVAGAAHDLLAVATPGGERLVPVVAAIVLEIDPGARLVRIAPPPGLLE